MLPDPNFALLIACCRRPLDHGSIALALTADVDWERFDQLAARHRVGGVVAQALRASGLEVPRAPRVQLARVALSIAAQNRMCAEEMVRLQARLDAADIPALFLKGPCVGLAAYGDTSVKHSKDIDLLVPPAQARAAAEVLIDAGYAYLSPGPRIEVRHWPALLRFHKDVTLGRSRNLLQVELHWRLAHTPRVLSGAAFPDVEPVRVELPGYGPVATLGPADTFSHLCWHGAISGWARLKWLAELQALVARSEPRELDGWAARCRAFGVGSAGGLAFAMLRRVFGEQTHQPELPRPSARMVRVCSAMLASPEPRPSRLAELGLQFGLAASAGQLLDTLARACVGPMDCYRFPLPRALHGIYPLLRGPLWLARPAREKVRSARRQTRSLGHDC